MKTRRFPKPLRWSIAALLLAGAVWYFRPHPQLPPLQTVPVTRQTVSSSVSGNGVLQPVTTVEVKSNVGGQVVQLLVEEGDTVQSGQMIARIDPADWQSALDQAKADQDSARARVDQASQTVTMQQLQTNASISSAREAREAARQRLAQAQQQAAIQPDITRETIRQAESSLESAKASLQQIRQAGIPQKAASAKAAYDQARAAYEQATRNHERMQALLAKGFVPRSDADTAEEQYVSTHAQMESARIRYETTQADTAQELRDAEARVDQAEAALRIAQANKIQDQMKRQEAEAARAALKQADAALLAALAAARQDRIKQADLLQAQAQMQKANASVTNARTQIGYTTITAPRSGVVVKKYVEEGSIVTAGRQAMAGSGQGVTLIEIADISRMQVLVDVDETDIGRVQLGQQVETRLDAFPDEVFAARVVKIAPKATITQNVTTVPVTVELTQSDPRFKPQMNATCEFLIDRKPHVLAAPSEAIMNAPDGASVMVLHDGRPAKRRVTCGLVGDEFTEITSGLAEGERVIIPDEAPADRQQQRGPFGGPGGPPPPM